MTTCHCDSCVASRTRRVPRTDFADTCGAKHAWECVGHGSECPEHCPVRMAEERRPVFAEGTLNEMSASVQAVLDVGAYMAPEPVEPPRYDEVTDARLERCVDAIGKFLAAHPRQTDGFSTPVQQDAMRELLAISAEYSGKGKR